MNRHQLGLLLCSWSLLAACGASDGESAAAEGLDPDTAPEVSVDRFGAGAMLQSRESDPGLPDPNEPVDFDQEPFVTRGLAPEGGSVVYYNFDVQPTQPAPIYVLMRDGENAPVAGQLNIVDHLPGMRGYSDFWRVMRVTVPVSYVINSVTSYAEIEAMGFPVSETDNLVNCPVVPKGSTAAKRWGGGATGLVRGWYRGEVVHYFSFEEAPLTGERVPTAPIFVTFNRNPGTDAGGPASGFVKEPGSTQTHNVLTALPGQPGYSPLWSVSPYDNADFPRVMDLSSVLDANVLARDVANVNCPVVEEGD
jgi:hypothetical protein